LGFWYMFDEASLKVLLFQIIIVIITTMQHINKSDVYIHLVDMTSSLATFPERLEFDTVPDACRLEYRVPNARFVSDR